MLHWVWQILTSLQRLITLDTKVQLQHGRCHLKDMTHIFLPMWRNKLITPFFMFISMVFCHPSTFCFIPGELHLLIIFYVCILSEIIFVFIEFEYVSKTGKGRGKHEKEPLNHVYSITLSDKCWKYKSWIAYSE